MPRQLTHRYRLHLSVPDTACPDCDAALSEDQLGGGDVTCRDCAHAWEPELEALDPLTDDRRRFRYLDRDELYRRLAAIARERNNTIGRRYLAEHDPELLFNCVAHHSTYTAARRHLRRWLANHPPVDARIVVRPRDDAQVIGDELPATPAAPEGPTAPAQSEGQSSTESGSLIRVSRRADTDSDVGRTCPYCRDVFEEDDASFACGCGAIFHPDCREELDRCTSLGCEAAYVRPVAAVTAAAEAAAEEEDVGFLTALHRRLFRDRLRLTYTNPWPLQLFGLPFILGGVGIAAAVAAEAARADIGALWALGLVALPFLLVGAAMTFGCRGATIDKRAGWVRAWHGLRIPFLYSLPLFSAKGRQRLDAFSEVGFQKDEWYRGNKGGGITVYPVSLDEEVLCAERDFLSARRMAERVGKFVDKGVRDGVGSSSFRPAGTLDRPLVDGIHYAPVVGGQPPTRRIEEFRSADGSPAYRVPGRADLRVPATLTTLIAVGAFLFSNAGGAMWACLAIGAIPILISFVHAMRRGATDTLYVTPRGLALARRWWLGFFRWTIPGDELEELVVSEQKRRTIFHSLGADSQHVLNLISDRRVFEVGGGLEGEELSWLRRSLARDLLRAQEGLDES